MSGFGADSRLYQRKAHGPICACDTDTSVRSAGANPNARTASR